MTKEYVVVENAGYEREHVVKRCKTYTEAIKFKGSYYDNEEELERLHVEIACEIDGERTYEI